MTAPTVLDPCCGSRMMWFDREDPRAVFGDIRREFHQLKDRSSTGGYRNLIIDPDVRMDFRKIPYPDNTFALVAFDPPHLVNNGKTGYLAKKYGQLGRDWRSDIQAGFAECFRVLRPEGTLVFKWNETDVPLAQVLALTDQRPLFDSHNGKNMKTHWLVFQKGGQP